MLKFTKHAREQMIERGISVSEVDEAIRMGVKTLQEDGKILAAHKYYKVAYKKEGEDCIIITVMLR